jgi:hypothetical protein
MRANKLVAIRRLPGIQRLQVVVKNRLKLLAASKVVRCGIHGSLQVVELLAKVAQAPVQ